MQYEKEQIRSKKVFLDLDGVLCNFEKGCFKLHDIIVEPWLKWDHYHKWFPGPEEQKKFWEPMGEEFWENLEWTSEGKECLRHVVDAVGWPNIGILTTPCDTKGSMEGKKNWIRREIPQLVKRFWPGSTKSFLASPNHVLIDDSDHNVDTFREAGGLAILAPRLYNKNRGLCDSEGNFDPAYIKEEIRLLLNR